MIASTLGYKYVMALTGIGLVLFVITHLAANLLLLLPNSEAFNSYANSLAEWGVFLNAAEFGLLILAIIHVILAVRLRLLARKARPHGYAVAASKMGPSKAGFASRNLIVTGVVIFVFLVLHVKHFKFGPGIEAGYATEIGGKTVRDLYQWVVESFQNPVTAGLYVLAMIFLGFHLKHGIWSSFQSLGATNSRTSTPIYRVGLFLALVLAAGFALIPIWIYFRG